MRVLVVLLFVIVALGYASVEFAEGRMFAPEWSTIHR